MKICIFSGSRSEYGLLKKIILDLQNDRFFKTDFIVSGSHLENEFGYSIDQVLKDKIRVKKKIKINIKKDKNWHIANAFSEVTKKTNNFFLNKNYDLVILLGDRYETFATAVSAYINRIPILHIHGGEKTFNSLDDNYRHSISKLSNIHLVSHELNKKRLIQLGENKKNIYVVGGLGANLIKDTKILEKNRLAKSIDLDLNKPTIIVNMYNEIFNHKDTLRTLDNIFSVIKKLKKINFVFTLPSHEINSKSLNNKIIKMCKKQINCKVYKNLGNLKYYSLLKFSDLIIGNSSSGVLEAPSFKIYTINIGSRQFGRIFSKSIINSDYNDEKLLNKILKFIGKKHNYKNPYYRKDTYKRIKSILKKIKLKDLKIKKFIDI